MGALPEWCLPLYDADTMRAIDHWAIEDQGVPSLDLMERAGIGVARAVEEATPDGSVIVLCGKGNNGGDGLVVARLLREAGRAVTVLTAGAPGDLRGDALANLERLPGDPPVQLGDGAPPHISEALRGAAVIVDALLGTGFAGEPRGALAEAIDAANAAPAPVISVDVPSGVDVSTGEVRGGAVRATLTVTFHAAKPGLWIHPGKAHAGEVRTIDIGIPRGAPPAGGGTVGLISSPVLDLLPLRGAASTKFSSGHVIVAGGSRGLTGAPRMAAHAAMRAGAGYLTACVPRSAQDVIVAAAPPELMTRGLPDEDGAHGAAGVQEVLDIAQRGGALALGPGLGRSPGAFAFARELARRAPLALVLDADGLNAHAGQLRELAQREVGAAAEAVAGGRPAPTVLTPHAGELGRLLEIPSDEIERARLHHVRAAAQLADAVVVLKGDDTLIADPTGFVAVSPGGSPALATAGTGDVLTGVIAALLAQGLPAFLAAAAGVWLHAAAGRLAARAVGAPEGVIASDVIAALPAARGEARL
jgi:ADP-dependent NAD(P)H-hydrate dehydratase / NAD(P)H-hydrate epimerase